jgi:L-fuculose-phosphate aldolase
VLRLKNLEQVEGNLKPSVESGMHAAMLNFKTTMFASIHTHQPLASAIALLNIDLPLRVAEDRQALGDHVAIVPYAPSGTGFLVRSFKRTLRRNVHAYLLKNHGVICAASSMQEAIDHVGRIEAAAAEFLRSHITSSVHLPDSIRTLTLDALAQPQFHKD